MGIFNEKEGKYIALTIFILTIVFGFNDGAETFEFSHWINNLFMVLIVVALSFLLAHMMHRLVAKKFFAKSIYSLWTVRRFGFAPHLKTRIMKKEFGIPAGILFPILFAIMSNGLWYLPLVGTYDLIGESAKRAGKIFIKLSGYERAIIYLAAPFTNLVLFFIFILLEKTLGIDFGLFTKVNMWMALFGLLPIPGLIGAEILFGSFSFYLFAVLFFVISIIFAPLSLLLAIPLALILALTLVVVYYIKISK